MNFSGRIWLLLFFSYWIMPGYGQLYITEFQASNITTRFDPGGNYLEWIEIFNAGGNSVNLQGYFLTDDETNPFFSEIGDFQIGAGSYEILWLDREGINVSAVFRIPMDGGMIGLFNPGGALVDSVHFPGQYLDISYGSRQPSSDLWSYFVNPTPGTVNPIDGITNIVVPDGIQFSLTGGFYSGNQSLQLTAPSGGGEIRYTDDGSWPSEGSMLYTGPIQISSTTVIRARYTGENQVPGLVITHTFIINDSSTLPVISLSTDPDNLFSDQWGIHVVGTNGTTGYCSDQERNFNNDWERPVNFEYFSVDGVQRVNQLTGTKIHGGCTRTAPNKSLAILARNKYGNNRLKYPFFQGKKINEYKTIVLRNSGDDNAHSMMRDGFMQSLLVDRMDIDYQAYQPAVIFVNGEYWGVLNVREKINEHYLASNYYMDSDDVDLLEKNYYLTYGVTVHGSGEHYGALIDFIESNKLSIQSNYEYVNTQMDVNEYMNYFIAEVYFQNEDWPHNNVKYWHPHVEGGKWRWILFDTDQGWGLFHHSENSLEWATSIENRGSYLIRPLLENDQFRWEFIQRMAGHINTTFAPEVVTPQFESMRDLLGNEIDRHMAKWNRPEPSEYERQMKWSIPQFTENRPDKVRAYVREKFGITGMFTLSAQVNEPDMGYIKACEVILPNDFSGTYFDNIPLRLEAVPRSGFTFSHWEGASTSNRGTISLNLSSDATLTAVFKTDTAVSHIFINEVCASNQSGPTDDFGQLEDWIEIYNDNEFDVDLAGWYLSDSAGYELKYQISYGQSGLTTVKAKDYLLVWCDDDSQQGPLHTNFNLKREGESLSLVQKLGPVIHFADSLSYPDLYVGVTFGRIGDMGQWEFLEPSPLALNEKDELNGIHIRINEFQASNCGSILDEAGEAEDWIEIYNPTTDTIDIGGLFLTDSLQDPIKHRIPAGHATTKIEPNGFIVLWADNQPEQGPLHLGFKLNSRNEQVGIYMLSGGCLDSLSYILDDGGIAVGRYPDGAENVQIVSASPGETNRTQYIENIYINEFMANNRATLSDESGEFDDWIEIYNDNDFPVDIGGVFVTDSLADPSKYRIPMCHSDSTTIPGKGFLLLWADNQEEQGVLHLDFKLNANGEEIGLVQSTGIDFLDSISYVDAIPDQAVGRLKDGSPNLQYLSSTPGSTNEVRGLENIFINEFLASNQSTHSDEHGDYDDWIEIYNDNDFQVDIGGLYITDSLAYPAKNRISSAQPDSTTIRPRGFIVLWADGQVEQGVLHLDFKLRSSGEQIGIVQPDGMEVIDSLSYSDLSPGQTIGRLEDGTNNLQIVTASPGFSNYINPSDRLYISEIVASDNVSSTNMLGENEDWIEIYNDNDFDVDIGGLYITDSLDYLSKFRIPSHYPDSTTIGAKGYLILWADNQPEKGINHLGFKLKGRGEQLALVGIDGRAYLDSVTYPNQYSNFSYSRMNNMGDWKFLRPTLCDYNTSEPISGISINEFMTSNYSIADEYGEFDDWIELFNANDFPVDIGGLYLTDSIMDATKYRIPSNSSRQTTIPPKGYYVLYADDNKNQGVNHTNFKLSRSGEGIFLIHYDESTVLDSLTYSSQHRNSSMGRILESGDWVAIPPTPGVSNAVPDLSSLVINEVMAYNRTVYGDEYNEYDDWIELYNGGEVPLDISGLFVSDSAGNASKFRISSEQPDSTTIPARDYFILWADNSEEQGVRHLGFSIAKTGEFIAIYDYQGELIDSVTYPFISPNLSWGRKTDGHAEWTRFYQPTPLMSNLSTSADESILSSSLFQIYPNPARNSFYISLGTPAERRGRYELLDMNGRVVLNGQVVPGKQVYLIEITHLNSGMYLLNWYESGQKREVKLIIKTE